MTLVEMIMTITMIMTRVSHFQEEKIIEKCLSYWELEENSRKQGNKQFLLYSEHLNHILL